MTGAELVKGTSNCSPPMEKGHPGQDEVEELYIDIGRKKHLISGSGKCMSHHQEQLLHVIWGVAIDQLVTCEVVDEDTYVCVYP